MYGGFQSAPGCSPAPHSIMKAALAFTVVLLSSCGYHVAGRADLIPRNIKTIVIPSWGNATQRFQLSSKIPAAVTSEFHRRTRYRVVADPNDADAILSGSILNYNSYASTYDSATGRATVIQLVVTLQVKLTERESGKVLWERPAYETRANYEVGVDPAAFIDESGPALDRLSNEAARSLVAAILENF